MSASDALFQETDPGVFVRKCIGMEAIVCRSSENGSAHTFYSCKVKLANDISHDDLKYRVQRSMVRLRHLVPAIACRVIQDPSGVFLFEYRVPKGLGDVLAWIEEAVFVDERGVSFRENHDLVYPQRWWKATEGRYTFELHVAPNLSEGLSSWTFTLSAHHANADGRISWMIFDKLFEFLSDEINGVAPPLSTFEWGSEVCRLPPAGPFVWSLDKTGKPEPLPAVDSLPPQPAPSEDMVPWTYPVRVNEGEVAHVDFTALIKLSREETSKFQAACGAHKKTATQVATALLALAHVETSLRVAGRVGAERFKEVRAGYDSATHFVTGMNAISMRPYMPDAYKVFGFERTTPLVGGDAASISFAFEPVRKMLSMDNENFSVNRNADKSVFWEELVPIVADAWNVPDKSVEAYRARSAIYTALANDPNFGFSEGAASVAPISSSFGDMTRLGLLESFRPASGNKTLVVEDLHYSTRSTLSAVLAAYFQYDGQFQMKLFIGAKYATQEELDLRGKVVKEWIDIMTQS